MENQPTNTKKIMPNIIAIDIAKDSLQVHCAYGSFSLENGTRGFKALLSRLPDRDAILVVFEATGGYERALGEFLHARNVPLSVVNPRLLRAFAKSEGIKAKTDPIDAEMIYRFATGKNLRPSPAPCAQQTQLSDLIDRRAQLAEFIAREKNRAQKTSHKAVIASLRRNIKALEKELSLIENQIRKLLDTHSELKASCRVITSVKGVGEVTAWTLLSQLREITAVNRNQLVALAGVAPYNNDSGAHRGKRFIYGGRSKVRRVLYMAAHTAARHNPVIHRYVEGLLARGKPYKCAITAAMRKLLLHIQSLLKSHELSLAS